MTFAARACRELQQPPQSANCMASTSLHVVDSLAAIPASRWDALIAARPLLSHEFLHPLHETGCASPRTGWSPCYITAWKDDDLIGAVPYIEKRTRTASMSSIGHGPTHTGVMDAATTRSWLLRFHLH